jgi:beta-glucosidase
MLLSVEEEPSVSKAASGARTRKAASGTSGARRTRSTRGAGRTRNAAGRTGDTADAADSEEILPDGFRFGVATSAFQVEGGLNGPGEPANNWVWWERAGRVEPSGSAVGFWDRHEEHLDRAAALGCDVFRVGIEWARVEPEAGEIDSTALDRYDAILKACVDRHMEPLVTLHHFTHPAWLGDDFWLSSDSPVLFADWVALVVDRLGSRCRHWITMNELNIVSFANYLIGIYPPGRRMALADFQSATAHLLAAHVKGYEQIHAKVPQAFVSTNNSATSVYEYDRLFIDLLLAPGSGIARDDLEDWVFDRRRAWYSALEPPSRLERLLRRASAAVSPIARTSFASGRARRADAIAASSSGASALEPAIDAIYSSPHLITLDALAIDYYDPVASNHVTLPGHSTAGGRSMAPGGELWDERVDPKGLCTYVRANVELSAEASANRGSPLEVWIVENGMCNRVRRGRSFDRGDGWDRPRFLRENVKSVVDAVEARLPVTAYLHWSLVDNYEWGSYEPRFGIHGVDRDRNNRVLDTDSMGRDSAGAYRRLIEGLRAGDRSVLEESGGS